MGLFNCLMWLLLTFGFVIHPDYQAVPIAVNGQLLDPILKDHFANGTKVLKTELIFEENKTYLIRKGFDDKENCNISRTELLNENIGHNQTYMMPIGGITETCSGDGCNHCAFKDEGGCECKSLFGRCNHTITKNWELLSFFGN